MYVCIICIYSCIWLYVYVFICSIFVFVLGLMFWSCLLEYMNLVTFDGNCCCACLQPGYWFFSASVRALNLQGRWSMLQPQCHISFSLCS